MKVIFIISLYSYSIDKLSVLILSNSKYSDWLQHYFYFNKYFFHLHSDAYQHFPEKICW